MVPNRLYPGQTPCDCPAQIIDIRDKRLIARSPLTTARSVTDAHQGIICRLKLGREPVQGCHEHFAPPVPPTALPLLERRLGVGLLKMGLLLRVLFGCPRRCRCRGRRRRRGILRW